jgi:signal transduction histidine kinase
MESPLLLAVSLALLAAQSLRAGRRRSALNQALHELRRPLQTLALATPGIGDGGPAAWSLQMASAALDQLDREINGGGGAVRATAGTVAIEPLLDAAVERWTARAALAGGSLQLRQLVATATVRGSRCELAQALDNLIANAIEHGRPAIVLEASQGRGAVRLAVVDSGERRRSASRRSRAATLGLRLRGRDRRGHGLAVVRRTVAAHDGSFALRRLPARTVAAIELPLISAGGPGA